MNRFKLVILLIAASSILCQDTVKKTPQQIIKAGEEGKIMLADLKNGNRHLAIARLEDGADPNVKDDEGETALTIAARNNDIELAVQLLDHNADPNISKDRGEHRGSPLTLALEQKHYELALRLISHPKTDVNLDVESLTPIQLAAQWNNARLVKALLEKGADPNKYRRNKDRANCYEDQDPILKTFNEHTEASPLAEAIYQGNYEMADLLLSYNAKADAHSLACSIINNLDILDRLINNESVNLSILVADDEYDFFCREKREITPLGLAIWSGNPDAAIKLIDAGAKIDVSYYNDNITALIHAACIGQSEVVDALLKHNANPTLGERGATALQLAQRAGDHKKLYEATIRWNRIHQAASSSNSDDTEKISSKYKEAVEQIKAPWTK